MLDFAFMYAFNANVYQKPSTPSLSHDVSIWDLRVGTVIRVAHDWYHHVALVGDRLSGGERTVLAFSAEAKGFIEQPFSAFARERAVTVEGFLGSLAPEVVMQRARSTRGKPYSWIDFNCEHFARFAHGVDIVSPQLHGWASLAGLLGLMAVVAARS